MQVHKLRKTTIIVVSLLLVGWILTCGFIYGANYQIQALNEEYRLGSGYRLIGWPGYLVKGPDEIITIVNENDRIDRIGVSPDYIVGRAANKWFSLNRNDGAIRVFSSENDARSQLAEAFPDTIFDSPPIQYRVQFLDVKKYLVNTSLVFLIAIMAVILVMVYLNKRARSTMAGAT